MNKICLLQPGDFLLSFYRFLIDQQNLDKKVEPFKGLLEVFPTKEIFLKKIKEYNVLVVNYSMPYVDEYLEYLKEQEVGISTIITFDNDSALEKFKKNQKYSPIIETFSYKSNPFKFTSSLQKLLKFQKRVSSSEHQYHSIKTKYFYSMNVASSDIFLQLKNDRFVKVFRRYSEYQHSEIEKYEKKGVNELYIREGDFPQFMSEVMSDFSARIGEFSPKDEQQKTIVTLRCHEAVSDIVNNIGVNESSVKLANQAILSTLDLVNNSNLTNVLDSILKGKDYISEHSLLVSFFVTGICRYTDWNNQTNILRLNLAAFFHDIKCPDEVVAKISDTRGGALDLMDLSQITMFKEHAEKACELVKQIGGIPSEVERVIQNHHEKYDGSGFPRSIDYKNLDPLSSIFILAHELVDKLYEVGFYRDSIFSILVDMKATYTRGSFGKAVDALIQTLGASTYVEENLK